MNKKLFLLFCFLIVFICFLNLKEQTINDSVMGYVEGLNAKNENLGKQEEVFLEDDEGVLWKLVFLDDFKNTKIDSDKWHVLDRKHNFNNELQAYKSKNVAIQNGRLNLTGLKEEEGYSSGLVQTKGKFDFLYGKVEIKASYPSGKGLFPAIWLLRSDGKDTLPEIDIFEAVGHEPEVAYMVQHWRNKGELKTVFGTKTIKNRHEDHIFGLEWEREEIRWYIDNKLVFKAKNYDAHVPMHLIINLAIGGKWPGSPNSSTIFPANFSVDYVKIYEREMLND